MNIYIYMSKYIKPYKNHTKIINVRVPSTNYGLKCKEHVEKKEQIFNGIKKQKTLGNGQISSSTTTLFNKS